MEAFDYNDPDCAKKIREYPGDNLKLCWDTISLEPTAKICADALSSDGEGCKYGAILNVQSPRPEVKSTYTLGYTAIGEDFDFGPNHDIKFRNLGGDLEFTKSWVPEFEEALASGGVTVNQPKVGPDGLKGALQGIDDVRNDRNSGTRLAYKVEETP